MIFALVAHCFACTPFVDETDRVLVFGVGGLGEWVRMQDIHLIRNENYWKNNHLPRLRHKKFLCSGGTRQSGASGDG